MGWSGKVIGGALGTVFAGPLGAAVGIGLGHLLDGAARDAEGPVTIEALSWTRCMGSSGPGMLVTVDASPLRELGEEATVFLWLLRDPETYVEAALEEWADAEGDVCAAGPFVERGEGVGRAVLYLPWAALPRLKGELLCEAAVFDGDDELGNGLFAITLPNRATREVHSALGALVYAAAAMLGRAGPLEQAPVEAALELLAEPFELDEAGLEVARRLFERAADKRPDLDKVVGLLDDEIEPDNQPRALELLHAVAGAAGPISRGAQAFLDSLCERLGLVAVEEPDEDPDEEEEEPPPDSPARPLDEVAQSLRALELEPGASLEQVRAAYRRLALDYHPDKVETLAKGFREYATERMQAINVAYEILKRRLR